MQELQITAFCLIKKKKDNQSYELEWLWFDHWAHGAGFEEIGMV